eukprot:CAMPEP_0118858672 /NCGR_PEP_ID=MMETSP1163-20130328/5247_1 /TAXON_ID=124430 /ORGANISM="Phaeomonas parva, Strain CCMP2877" /LENGTH=49 /DNA_ID=CAMNT_0006792155 /DNA_START=39 /DNA_END=188 /DNA_ORIENTATION=-
MTQGMFGRSGGAAGGAAGPLAGAGSWRGVGQFGFGSSVAGSVLSGSEAS